MEARVIPATRLRTLRSKTLKIKENIPVYLRIFISLVVSLALLISSLVFQGTKTEAQYFPDFSLHPDVQKNLTNTLVVLTKEDIANAQIRKEELERKRAEEERLRKERDEKINRTLAYLSKQKSPVANKEVAAILVDLTTANNADYRILIAIMGTESGYCRASFYYNCFGYLNKVKYSSYKDAFKDLVPKISRQYAARYGWNFEALARAYGQVNWELGAAKMRRIANSI